MVRASMALAASSPSSSLMELETRMAVVKSSSFRLYWIEVRSVKVPGNGALHQAAVRNAAHGGMVLGDRGAPGRGGETAHQDGALAHHVDGAIGPLEGGHEQGAPGQGLGVPGGADGHIHALTGLGEGRQFGRHHHRRHVLDLHGGGADGDALAGHEVGQGLHRELGLVLVAGAIQAHDDAVAQQLVAADALEPGHILELGLHLLVGHAEERQGNEE